MAVSEKQNLISFLDLNSKCESNILSLNISVLTEEARRPWVWGGAGLFLGLLVVVCDQLIPQKPAVQVSHNEKNYFVTD